MIILVESGPVPRPHPPVLFRRVQGIEGEIEELYIPERASLIYQIEDDTVMIIKVETEENYRNQGYATKLLKEFLRFSDQHALAVDLSGYLPDGERYLKPLLQRIKPHYPHIVWLD